MYTFNLKKRRASRKDYSHHRSLKLGTAILQDFTIPSIINNQGEAEDCTAYSACGARDSEVTNGDFDPAQFWIDECSFTNNTGINGFDIQVPAATAVKSGFSPMGNPSIRQNKPSAYFWITPNNGMSFFESVMQAVSQSQYPALLGLDWFQEWTDVSQGIIDSIGKNIAGGHCIRVAAMKTINGFRYAGLPNTWGTNMGDGNGWYWIREDVFNKINGYGCFIWSDSSNVTIKTLGLITALYQNMISLLRNIIS